MSRSLVLRSRLPAVFAAGCLSLTGSVALGAPYPSSPVITGIDFGASKSAGEESDNWPLTWADDGHLYVTYGDGWGFEDIQADAKLSMGFARVEGTGEGFRGYDIRSSTGETVGNGSSGQKGSGILMVDGVLYVWARNANNDGTQSQLLWSSDHARTWTWSDWKFAELGFPCFLNFGRNYAGARDGYVYMYSPDTNHAYNETDDVVLTRVPRGEIRTRSAYEFFRDLDAGGRPVWTSDITKRGSVFHFPGGCNRLDVVFDPGIDRYLMTMRSRAKAGGLNQFSIYDAPEPWGPWTTVYYESGGDRWGEHQHFPSKWIAADGKTLYMVHAGSDQFNSTKVTLTVSTSPQNKAPVASDQSVTTLKNTPKEIALDCADDGPTPYTFTIVSGPSHGALSGTGGTRTYTPETGFAGGDGFTWKVTDGEGADSNAATCTITVAAQNQAPVASDRNVGTPKDTPKQIALDYTDPDGPAPHVFEIVSGPSHGTLSGTGAARTYTPDTGFTGGDGFTWKVTDGEGAESNAATCTVTVADVWAASGEAYEWGTLAAGEVQYIDRDYAFSSVPSRYAGLRFLRTANDDKESTADPFVTFSADEDLTVYIAHDDRITHKPTWLGAFTDTGDDLVSAGVTFSLFARDQPADLVALGGNGGGSGSSMYTVVVRPAGANSSPTAPDGVETTQEGMAVAITLRAADADGDALTFSVVSGPSNGGLSGAAPDLTYTPDSGFTGEDSFTFRSNDGQADSNVATVTITVVAAPATDTDTDGMDDDWETDNFGDTSHDGTADPDGDGLTDLLEYVNGTDPLDADTDGDGYADGDEVAADTDPANAASHPGGGGSTTSATGGLGCSLGTAMPAQAHAGAPVAALFPAVLAFVLSMRRRRLRAPKPVC